MVISHFTKEIIMFLVFSTIIAIELTSEFKDKVWRKHGLSESILSDHGPQFVFLFWQELLEQLNIKSHLMSPYHP